MKTELPAGDPGLSISSVAHAYVVQMLSKAQKPALGLRVSVKKAGCSGYEYDLQYAYAENLSTLDFEFKVGGFSLIVDKEIYLKFLRGGTVIDIKKDGLNQSLHFINPNVGYECGCGESFTLKDESSGS